MPSGRVSKSRIPRRVKRPASELHGIQAQSLPYSFRPGPGRCFPQISSRIPLPTRATAQVEKTVDKEAKDIEAITEMEVKRLSEATERAFKAMFRRAALTSRVPGTRTITRRTKMASMVPDLDANCKWQSSQQVRKQIQEKRLKRKMQSELRKKHPFKDQPEVMRKIEEFFQDHQEKQKQPGEQAEKPKLLKRFPHKLISSLISRPSILKLFKEKYPITLESEGDTSEPDSVSSKESYKMPEPEIRTFRCNDDALISIPTDLLFRYSKNMAKRKYYYEPIDLPSVTSSTLMNVVYWMKRHREMNGEGEMGVDWVKVIPSPGNGVPETDNETNPEYITVSPPTTWEKHLWDGDQAELLKLSLAASHLGIHTLAMNASQYLVVQLENSSRFELQRMQGIRSALSEVMEDQDPILQEIVAAQGDISPYNLSPSNSDHFRQGSSSSSYETCSTFGDISHSSTAPDEATLDKETDENLTSEPQSPQSNTDSHEDEEPLDPEI